MVWGGFAYNGTTDLAEISLRLDSEGYQSILKNYLLKVGRKIAGTKWIFQQDNASIHRSNSTMAWLNSKKVRDRKSVV